jgi:hypothetical protein
MPLDFIPASSRLISGIPVCDSKTRSGRSGMPSTRTVIPRKRKRHGMFPYLYYFHTLTISQQRLHRQSLIGRAGSRFRLSTFLQRRSSCLGCMCVLLILVVAVYRIHDFLLLSQ